MRRFFIDPTSIDGNVAVLTGAEKGHIRRVLRLKTGDMLSLFDGAGNLYMGKIVRFAANEVEIAILERHATQVESRLQMTVAQSMLKAKKMDEMVRRVTELGATAWFPVTAGRSIPRPGEKEMSARKARWERIAREAAKQCGRGVVPAIEKCLTFHRLIDESRVFDLKIVFSEKEAGSAGGDGVHCDPPPSRLLVLFGPEGGFEEEELNRLVSAGFISASLGPRILRSETATIAGCTLIQHLFGDMKP